ncbi:hypothetical protein Pla22_12550 [Rubripirellula amarantea]|uniref:Uncharacterized protein n=1 Tax=Rubripirellula amarantea TaxID=2527999 RepID=A0A5C5WUE2_9BACT|nr:hypothetical protein [Rubripirellula amarantea]TWT53625.1 hypothetical protein Pla22_12550 [Rubripirellula amarantea]
MKLPFQILMFAVVFPVYVGSADEPDLEIDDGLQVRLQSALRQAPLSEREIAIRIAISEETQDRVDRLIHPFITWGNQDGLYCCDLDVVDTYRVPSKSGKRVRKVEMWDGFFAVDNKADVFHFARLLSDSEEEFKRDGIFSYGSDGRPPLKENKLVPRSGSCFGREGRVVVELLNGQRYSTSSRRLLHTLGLGPIALGPACDYNGFKSTRVTADDIIEQVKTVNELLELNDGETWTLTNLGFGITREMRWAGKPKMPIYTRLFKSYVADGGNGPKMEYTFAETTTEWVTESGENPRLMSIELFQRDPMVQNSEESAARMIIDFEWHDAEVAARLGIFDEKSLGLFFPPLKPTLQAEVSRQENAK